MYNQTRKALQLAQELFPTTYDGGHRTYHFAFLFRRNRLLAIGSNDMAPQDSRAMRIGRALGVRRQYPSRHAEIDALSRLWGRTYIDGTLKLVVLRLNRFGQLQESRPCRACRAILDALGITAVAYSTRAGVIVDQQGREYDIDR